MSGGRGRTLTGFNETTRWQVLANVQKSYLSLLDEIGQWDRQTARLYAIEHHECVSDQDIILLGTVDMNRTMRAMLDQVASRVTALVYAPAAYSNRFDEHGCVIPAAWQDVPLNVETEQITLADGPSNQADAVIHALDELDGQYRADQITIGVPDATLLPHLEKKTRQSELPARWGPGQPLSGSRPVLLMRFVVDYVNHGRFRDLAELVRHPDIEQWLEARQISDAIPELDRYFETHLQELVPTEKSGVGTTPAAAIAIAELLGPLTGGVRRPGDWVEELTTLLMQIYGDYAVDPHNPEDCVLLSACEQLQNSIDELRELPDRLAPEVSATAAILMALGQFGEKYVPTPRDEDAIEMLGWLELPLDDAPALIVTGFNEGVVPQSVNSDLFLPNRLRSQLGIDDNQRRYARDAYALQVLLASRKHLRLIVGRRTAEGDPLCPSRLLLAVDQDTVAQRCLRFFDPEGSSDVPSPAFATPREHSGFYVPRPQPLAEPIRQLSVTDFRNYIACPYRFYLQRVLGLAAVASEDAELDAALFGTLAHDVLAAFGRGPCRDSANEAEITDYLWQQLRVRSRRQFGRRASPTIQVQLEQLRLRFAAFARAQSAWRLSGWRITEHVEVDQPDGGVLFHVDDAPILLRGRIDRIDVHDSTGAYAILDYKTGETAASPEAKHRGKRPSNSRQQDSSVSVESLEWIDLQLPLYRHLARGLSIAGEIKLGYVLLPKNTEQTAFQLADWTDQELAEADEVARDVVRRIRDEQFWPPTDPAPFFGADVAPICQDGVFNRQLQEAVTA